MIFMTFYDKVSKLQFFMTFYDFMIKWETCTFIYWHTRNHGWANYRPPRNFLRPVHSFSELARVVVGISIFGIAFPLQIECVDDDPVVRENVTSAVLLVIPACIQKESLT